VCRAVTTRLLAVRICRYRSKLIAVEAAAQAEAMDHIHVVRAGWACKHWAQMDVEIPGGRW